MEIMNQEKLEKIICEFERFIQEYDRDIGFTSYDSEVLQGVLTALKGRKPVEFTVDEFKEMVSHASVHAMVYTSDCVNVVRCKDCKYGESDTNGNGEDMVMCQNKLNPVGFEDWLMPPEWFCADGERREIDGEDA